MAGTMGLTRLLALAAGLLLALGAPTALAQANAGHARVSFDAGGLLVKGAQDADWASAPVNTLLLPGDTVWVDQGGTGEVELPGLNFVRMADGSKAELLAMPPSATVRGWTGAFYVHRLSRSTGDFVFQSPAATVQVPQNSMVRVDILTGGQTTVSVRWGSATVRVANATATPVQAGQRVFVDPGLLPSAPVSFDRSAEDAFDTWNRGRAEYLAVGPAPAPAGVTYADNTLGTADLANNGEWVYIDNRSYWRPTVVVDYVPYRYGTWSYVPAYGHVWVGCHPWSYVTTHYGRWNYFPTYGWCWAYDPVWSPAWCATVRYGDNFLWTPIGFDYRPVRYGSTFFSVGGVDFYFGATSYVPSNYLYYGYNYVNPFRPDYYRSIYTNDVYIWNININNYGNDFYRHLPFRDIDGRVRDYTPRRSIRGPEFTQNARQLAGERAQRLERNFDAPRFVGENGREVRAVRTDLNARRNAGEVTRTVRLDDRLSRDPNPTIGNRNVRGSGTTPGGRNLDEPGRGDSSPRSVADIRPRTGTGDPGVRAPLGSVDTSPRTARPEVSNPRADNPGTVERTPVREPVRLSQPVTRGTDARTGTVAPRPRITTTGREGDAQPRSDSGSRTVVRQQTQTPAGTRQQVVNPRTSVPERNLTPPSRNSAPSTRDITPPPSRNLQVPTRDLSPPERNLSTPNRNLSAPNRNVSPPPAATPPPARTYVTPPNRNLTVPERNVAPPTRDLAPSTRNVAPPTRDLAPPTRNVAPPARNLEPPARNLGGRSSGSVSSGDSSPGRSVSRGSAGDFAPRSGAGVSRGQR